MQKIKFGIIGFGVIGTKHIQSILEGKVPELELVAVADQGEERRTWARQNVASVQIFQEGADLINSGLCEAVLISVPHYQHPDLAIKAFQQGLHVLSEKPIAVYVKQVRAMIEAADTSGKAFAVMFNQRTNRLLKKMHALIQGGELGAIKRVNWIATDLYRPQNYYDSGQWRATWDGEGGGVLLNQASHNLDILQWVCGMPNKVRAACHNGKWHKMETEDDITAYLEYPNGATGVFITSTADAPGTNRFEVTLEYGKLVCENNKLLLYRLKENERVICKTSKENYKIPDHVIEEVPVEEGGKFQHVEVLNAFASHILRGTPLIADGREGINSLGLSNAIYYSSWKDKTVELPVDDNGFLAELNARRSAPLK